MTTREKIIVGVMCLTIFYGAYELLGNKGTDRKKSTGAAQTNPLKELRDFVSGVTQKMVKEKMSVEYQYMVEQAGMDWAKDPFIASSTPLKSELTVKKPAPEDAEPSLSAPDFNYTGFLQLGDKKLAVINGTEYTTGESLGIQGYYVKRIAPNRVVLGNVDSSEVINLTIQEEY